MKMEHFSASRRKTFEECQLKYRACYEMGLEKEPHPLTNMGSAIHHMFEHSTNVFRGKKEGSSDPFTYEAEAVKKFNVLPEHVATGRQLVKNAVDWGWFRNPDRIAGIETEIAFTVGNGIQVTGFIDRLDQWGDTADIKDLKTQKKEFSDEELALNWQARIYNIGARKLFPAITGTLDVSFWVLRHRVQKISLDAADAARDMVSIAEAADEIMKCDDPKANPSGLCPWCPFYEQCPDGKSGRKPKRMVVPSYNRKRA